MFLCDIATVGPTVHAWHVALHLGLASLVSVGGSLFLGLGVAAHRRARRDLATEPRRTEPRQAEPRRAEPIEPPLDELRRG